MGCLIFLLALIGPRVALLFVWVATEFVERAFDGFLVPLLGLIFLPWTTLTYVLVYDGSGVSALGWFFVVLALVGDISSWTLSGRRGYQTRAV